MKNTLLTFLIAMIWSVSVSQNFNEIVDYKFSKKESYWTEKNKVLQCANYLFSTPCKENENNRAIAVSYIMKWMEGTPDYTFEIGSEAMELTKGSSDLFGLYLAAMTKVVLENEEEKMNRKQIYVNSENLLVEYCSNTDNKLKPSKRIKKIIKNNKV